MSAEIYSTNNASASGTTVGGNKPLHRFIKGQPKIMGVVVLVLGSSFFTISIAIMADAVELIWIVIPPGFLMGILFIICGILYIVTEHNPTKKTVTISLALSIVTLLGTFSTILFITPSIIDHHLYRRYDYPEFLDENGTETVTSEIPWSSYYEAQGVSVEVIYIFNTVVGTIILIVMSTLAGAALRPTNSQAIIMMTAASNETPVE